MKAYKWRETSIDYFIVVSDLGEELTCQYLFDGSTHDYPTNYFDNNAIEVTLDQRGIEVDDTNS